MLPSWTTGGRGLKSDTFSFNISSLYPFFISSNFFSNILSWSTCSFRRFSRIDNLRSVSSTYSTGWDRKEIINYRSQICLKSTQFTIIASHTPVCRKHLLKKDPMNLTEQSWLCKGCTPLETGSTRVLLFPISTSLF